MGWRAVYKNGVIKNEGDTFTNDKGEIEGVGRPVSDGENGQLVMIAQEDFGHKVAIDLIAGRIAIDYEDLRIQNGSIELVSPKVMFWITEGETNIVGQYFHREESEVDEDGNYTIAYAPLVWRPIWMTRFTNNIPTKVVGAQTTTPKEMGTRNVKRIVSLFADGTIGID